MALRRDAAEQRHRVVLRPSNMRGVRAHFHLLQHLRLQTIRIHLEGQLVPPER